MLRIFLHACVYAVDVNMYLPRLINLKRFSLFQSPHNTTIMRIVFSYACPAGLHWNQPDLIAAAACSVAIGTHVCVLLADVYIYVSKDALWCLRLSCSLVHNKAAVIVFGIYGVI